MYAWHTKEAEYTEICLYRETKEETLHFTGSKNTWDFQRKNLLTFWGYVNLSNIWHKQVFYRVTPKIHFETKQNCIQTTGRTEKLVASSVLLFFNYASVYIAIRLQISWEPCFIKSCQTENVPISIVLNQWQQA